MKADMPLDRSGEGRTIETERWIAPTREPLAPRRSDEFVSDRFLVPTRMPISPRQSAAMAADDSEFFAERWLPDIRESLGFRGDGRSIEALRGDAESSPASTVPGSPVGGVGLPSSPPSGDWLDNYVGSYLASLFGGEIGTNNQQNLPRLSSVPVVSSGQGSSTGLILLVLAAGGVAVYWFYFRKKRSVSDG